MRWPTSGTSSLRSNRKSSPEDSAKSKTWFVGRHIDARAQVPKLADGRTELGGAF